MLDSAPFAARYRLLSGIEHAGGVRTYFFAGDVAAEGLALAADVVEAGACAAVVAAGLAASDDAGRNPRLLGLFSMLAARLFSIFAVRIATSTNAELRISFRWFVKATVICCRTP